MADPNGMTVKDLVMEVRRDVKKLDGRFDEFEKKVVLKEDLDLWHQSQITTRRWAIGTIISLAVFGVMLLAYLSANPIVQQTVTT